MTTPSLREATEEDRRFIASSWHTSYWKRHASKRVPGVIYRDEMRLYIAKKLDSARVLVAFFEDVPDEILGYSVVEGLTLHWVYVKAAYRRNGIGSGLVPLGLQFYSHETDTQGRDFLHRSGLRFNPFKR